MCFIIIIIIIKEKVTVAIPCTSLHGQRRFWQRCIRRQTTYRSVRYIACQGPNTEVSVCRMYGNLYRASGGSLFNRRIAIGFCCYRLAAQQTLNTFLPKQPHRIFNYFRREHFLAFRLGSRVMYTASPTSIRADPMIYIPLDGMSHLISSARDDAFFD